MVDASAQSYTQIKSIKLLNNLVLIKWNEWMNKWMNEWINEWMNEWMNQWMNE